MNTALARVTRLVSNRKAYAAALTPVVLAAGTLLSNWISSGAFDATELRIAAGGLATAAATGIVTWLTSAGDAEVEIIPGSQDWGDEGKTVQDPGPEDEGMAIG